MTLAANPRAAKFSSSRKEVARTAEVFQILGAEIRKLRAKAEKPEKPPLRFVERMNARGMQ